jgi:hypothetical protein
MMQEHSGFLKFRIDPTLPSEVRRGIESLLANLKDAEIEELHGWKPKVEKRIIVDFVSEASLHLLQEGNHLRICVLDQNQGLFSYGQSVEESLADAVLNEGMDLFQIEYLIRPNLIPEIIKREDELTIKALKNFRKFEAKAKLASQKMVESSSVSADALLTYAQALVDLEKDLIHSDDPQKTEKAIKQFAKVHLSRAKFHFWRSGQLWKAESSFQMLLLPRHKNSFQSIELHWDDDNDFEVIKKFLFYFTLVSFFQSQQEIKDPFFEEKLWESALDAIPFPVALMSEKAEVYQHNTLFAKLNFTPVDCLRLKLREKVMINEIPYNVYRKDIYHLDEKKFLFVFFTESFFLKGEGNLTPSGQELGIISSSIAHELNNPIAGIQAALTLLMLDESLCDEAKTTLGEMKNGATRCKQLIETFLGFSRANPNKNVHVELRLSPIEISYQQAQNLLRFRTVESGIRFSLEYSKHTDFRATVNLSLLTMTFYLIMGELMTLYSHQLLVANKNQIEKVIKGEIIESSQEIQIQLHELNIASLSLSKLIQNLLTIENFVLQVSDYSLRFIYNPPKN